MRRLVSSFAVALLFTASAYADVVFEIEQKELNPESTGQIKGKVKGSDLRMDMYEDGGKLDGSMIYKGASKEMIMIDHDDKTFVVLDEATMSALAAQLGQMMSQMEEQLKSLPPDQREQMKQMMGMGGGGDYVEPVLKKTGKGEVNGVACEKYDVLKGAERVREYCVTPWSSIEGGQEMMNLMMQMADSMDKMMKSFSIPGSPVGSQVEFEENVFSQLRELNGFPVETIDFDDGEKESVSTFSSSKKTTVDASEFAPPSDYTKQSMALQ
ncbi:MAG: hypothetical protein IT344_00270 [Candidatus Dadabacteria bacterium]|nr:hypothetical protein [Candidatus Dadabacteria bacterium]